MKNNNKEKLVLEDVTLSIGEKEILKKIDVEIAEGQTLVIIGESGSGKTMLSKMLIGGLPKKAKTGGSIVLHGKNLLELGAKEFYDYRGNVIAYIAQNPMSLFNQMQTIKSHAVELFKSKLSISASESEERLIKALTDYNFADPASLMDKYPFQLSGGMLQRIMFAMMLELSPKFLIADEPTSALDEDNTSIVIDALKKCRERGIGVIVITHNYEIVKELADMVLIIKYGEQIEYASKEQILSNPTTEYSKKLLAPRVLRRYSEVAEC